VRRAGAALGALFICAALVYVRDPPWLGRLTTGFGSWEQAEGIRFRWMGGRASFFVPSGSTKIEIPLQAPIRSTGGDPFVVDVRVDDKPAAEVIMRDEGWTTATIVVPPIATRRRFRRIDVFANRTWGERSLSVRVGEVITEGLARRGAPVLGHPRP